MKPIFSLALGLVLFAAGIQAQNMPVYSGPGSETANPQPPAQQEDQSVETLKVNVNIVQIFFNVKDKKGALIPSLTKSDFDIAEDGKPQTIKYFTAESDLPLTLGILIDSSGSQMRVLDMEKQVGGDFLSTILRDKDLAFVMNFDVNAELIQDFTSSVSKLKHSMNDVRINTGGGGGVIIPGGGGNPVPSSTGQKGTVLYDAVYLAAHDELSQQVGRKAMILLTDGEDEGSQLRIKDAIEAAQKADTIVYVLLCADRGFYGLMGYSGDSEMKKLTSETGGRVIEVGNKQDKLRDAFNQISNELRSQYNIGYTPTNNVKDGSFRKIEIQVKGNKDYKIQSRNGYYAMAKQD